MSLEEFTTYYQTQNNKNLFQFVKKHRATLVQIDSDDLYGVILKSHLHESIKYFAESKYPWKELLIFHALEWNDDVQLQKDDLSETRMFECESVVLYTKILINFLQIHEIEDIPQSFLEHEFSNVSHLIATLSNLKIDSNISLNKIMTKNISVNKKYFHLFCYYFERHFDELYTHHHEMNHRRIERDIDENHELDPDFKREATCDAIKELLHQRFDDDDDEDELDYYYKSIKVDKYNIIEIFFDMVKNNTSQIHEDYLTISRYFEWMSLDEQLTFWNLVCHNEEDDDRYDAIDITMMSESTTFINFAFDHLPNCYESICNRNDENNDSITFLFWDLFVKKYPEVKNYVYTNIMLTYHHSEYMYIFEDVSVQEMLKVLKDILL